MFSVCLVPTAGQNWEQQWSYLLSHFKPKNIYALGHLHPTIIPFREYIKLDTAEDIPETLVVMSPKNAVYVPGTISIHDFEHPDECCYLFGSDSTHLSIDQLGGREPDHAVYIPVDTNDTMYSFMAGAITLYDRRLTRG